MDARKTLIRELEDKIKEARRTIEAAKSAPADIKEAESILRVLGVGSVTAKVAAVTNKGGMSVREAVNKSWKDGASVADIGLRIHKMNLAKVVDDPKALHNNIRMALFSMEKEKEIKRQKADNGRVIFVKVKNGKTTKKAA
jgi:hypothetical protein